MSLPRIMIVDVQHDNEPVEIEELTHTGIGTLIFECEQLLEQLKDAAETAED